MAVDPADYPETTRGYPYPTQINAGGAAANAATDPPADLKRLAEAVDADVAAVEAAAGSATSGVASDLADHEADTTAVHGIADTSALVTTARQVIAGTGLTGGGTLAADRTLAVAYGSSAGTAAQGNDARLSDTRTPTDGTVTTAKIVDSAVTSAKIADGAIVDADVNAAAAIAKTKIAGTAITAADTGTVTDTMLAGSITPAKVTGTAVVQTVATTKGDLPVRGTSALERLAVGTIGTNPLLIPDTSASGGLKWGTHAEADVAKASQVGNLLTANQASIETDTAGFLNPFGCTIARSTTEALSGAASLAATATGAALYFLTPPATAGVPVSPGGTYTFSVWAKAGGASATGTPYIQWYNGATKISESGGSAATISSSGWMLLSVTAVAPATATHAAVYPFLTSATIADVYYFDCFGFWLGAGGLWVPPGVPVPNLGSRANPADATQVQVWNPGNATWITV